jgi:hypothetical protein
MDDSPSPSKWPRQPRQSGNSSALLHTINNNNTPSSASLPPPAQRSAQQQRRPGTHSAPGVKEDDLDTGSAIGKRRPPSATPPPAKWPAVTNPHTGSQTLPPPHPRMLWQRRLRQSRHKQTIQGSLPFPSIPTPIPEHAIPPDQCYGDGVGPKAEGIFRLAYGNIDGFQTVPFNNPKANLLKHWL